MSKYEITRGYLEHDIFEDIEPCDWSFEKDGLWLPKQKPRVFKKSDIKSDLKCIDEALKKIYGKDWNKPFKRSYNGRT